MLSEINKDGTIKNLYKRGEGFFRNKKIQIILSVILLFMILFMGVQIRLQNINLLIDNTTGKNIPLALDSFYFLRIAESIENGNLSDFDTFRKPFNVEWSKEILPSIIVLIYRVGNLFYPISIQYADIIYPIIFFILGIIAFFALTLILTNSKRIALLSCFLLSIIPTYLYRTIAGFSDHDILGMFFFFLTMVAFSLSLRELNDKNTKNKFNFIYFGIVVGFISSLTFVSWGGIASILNMVISLSIIIYFIIERQTNNKKTLQKIILFYLIYLISFILSTYVIFNYEIYQILKTFMGIRGIFIIIGFLFLLCDFGFLYLKKSVTSYNKIDILYSIVITILIGFILTWATGNMNLFNEIIIRLLHPFGTSRISLSVAENRQLFLQDWINQVGKTFFWIFYFGLILFGKNVSKNISGKKRYKKLYFISWLVMIFGMIFSKVSPNSILNGDGFLSKFLYFGGIIFFFGCFFYIYLKDRIKISENDLIILIWIFFMMITLRGATRFFFVVTPMICFISSYLLIELYNLSKQNKENITKFIFLIVSIVIIIYSIHFYIISNAQAKQISPYANIQWQEAMQWVRENTYQDEIFINWWDYGYLIEYLGQRPTIADGGHFQGSFRNHLIGRYVLTTPKPETALSFMKSNNISYLLIDYTDLMKYSSYSKIGSDFEEDRYSWISIFEIDNSIKKEINNETKVVYVGRTNVDEEITYGVEDNILLLPKDNSIIVGFILYFKKDEIINSTGIFYYNGKSYQIPIRYVYYAEDIYDFGKGLNATLMIIPKIEKINDNLEFDERGGLIYLSQKTMDSLFVQLYLMDDIFNKYPTMKLVYNGQNKIIKSIKEEGYNVGDFVIYDGFKGSIKIWKIEYPEDIVYREEFLKREGELAEFDNLTL